AAVRRALDALAPHRNAWPMWRPRIEHAQCVHPKDMVRMARIGVIASMQPIHAIADRELADAMWPGVTKQAYAWRALEEAGVRLAFGSDSPVETADPLAGIEAATAWRRRARWHPELALTRASALRAYTAGAAYAAGMESELGALRPRKLCDMTVVDDGGVVVIRKFVQHHDRPLGPPHHQPRVGVVGMLDHAAEQASGSLLAGDVLHPPGRPESMH